MTEIEPIICFTLARAENSVIGKDGGLAWRLPDDFKHFKDLTLGKPVIMGRATLTDDLKKPLPGRPNIVVTRDEKFQAEGVIVAHTIEDALRAGRGEAKRLGAGEVHVIGGAEIFRLALRYANRIYLTEVHGSPEGNVRLPEFDRKTWREDSRERHDIDERHEYAFSNVTLERQNPA